MVRVNADEVADTVLGVDGPYDPEAVIGAARVIAELVRRLNHATLNAPGNLDTGHVDRLVDALGAASNRLPQLYEQVSARLEVLSAEPNLTVASNAVMSAPHVALNAALDLRAASTRVQQVTEALQAAAHHTGRLGMDDDE